MAVAAPESIRIPVANIPRRGVITDPERGAEHLGVKRTLEAEGKPIFSQGGFGTLALRATSPHTLGEQDVWWFNDQRTAYAIHWTEASSSAIFSEHADFWRTLQKKLYQELAQRGNHFRAYGYVGFLFADSYPQLPPNVYSQGMQSQMCPHWHITEGFTPNPADSWLDAKNSEDQEKIGRVLNLGGEAMVAHLEQNSPDLFKEFGIKIQTEQTFGSIPYRRTFFAFQDLAAAIQASMQLRQTLEARWIDTAATIVSEHEFLASVWLPRMQSAIPNFAFIIPSGEDRQRANRKQAEVWVSVGTVAGVPEMLTPGGLYLNRLR